MRKFNEFPCLTRNWHGKRCNGVLHKAHILKGAYAGKKLKPDQRIVPLCAIHHGYQHNCGEVTFWGEALNDAINLAKLIDDKKVFNEQEYNDIIREIVKFRRKYDALYNKAYQ